MPRVLYGLASALRIFAFHAGAKEPRLGSCSLSYFMPRVLYGLASALRIFAFHAGAKEPQLFMVALTLNILLDNSLDIKPEVNLCKRLVQEGRAQVSPQTLYNRKDIINKPQTKLGKQLAKMFNRKDSAFILVSSGDKYDTFQCEVSDNKIISLICHDYSGLAYGILINTKLAYPVPGTMTPESLVRAINQANLKSTSVITAMELHDNNKMVTLHFKTFVHLTKRIAFARLLDKALELHLQEIDVVITPHFESIDKDGIL